MHKSALTFGLLASSLVMLVIMPFLNHTNSFLSNPVMAQGYMTIYGDIVIANIQQMIRNMNAEQVHLKAFL